MIRLLNIKVCLFTGMFGYTIIVQLIMVQPRNMFNIEPVTSSTLFAILGVIPFIVLVCITQRNKNWFLIIPARINPYKLVYKVTHFARQHKVPVQRSAFTYLYCEDEIPTGLDLAKTKYGGPYTTEDVENVKAFYGILKMLLSLSPVFALLIAADHSVFWYIQSISPNFYVNLSYRIIINYFFDDNTLSSASVVLVIPLYLLVFRKICIIIL